MKSPTQQGNTFLHLTLGVKYLPHTWCPLLQAYSTSCPFFGSFIPPTSPQSSCRPLSSAQRECYLATGCWMLRYSSAGLIERLWEAPGGVHNTPHIETLQNTSGYKVEATPPKCGRSPTLSSAQLRLKCEVGPFHLPARGAAEAGRLCYVSHSELCIRVC